jgi:hypothetical protein
MILKQPFLSRISKIVRHITYYAKDLYKRAFKFFKDLAPKENQLRNKNTGHCIISVKKYLRIFLDSSLQNLETRDA